MTLENTGDLVLLLPVIGFIGTLIGLGTSIFGRIFGGKEEHPLEKLDISPPPPVPTDITSTVLGFVAIALGVFLYMRR